MTRRCPECGAVQEPTVLVTQVAEADAIEIRIIPIYDAEFGRYTWAILNGKQELLMQADMGSPTREAAEAAARAEWLRVTGTEMAAEEVTPDGNCSH